LRLAYRFALQIENLRGVIQARMAPGKKRGGDKLPDLSPQMFQRSRASRQHEVLKPPGWTDALLEPFELVTTNLRYRSITKAVKLRAVIAGGSDARDHWATAYCDEPLRKWEGRTLPSYELRP
jgi:hypothetical protein